MQFRLARIPDDALNFGAAWAIQILATTGPSVQTIAALLSARTAHEALDTLAREGTRCAARDGAREAECSVNGEQRQREDCSISSVFMCSSESHE